MNNAPPRVALAGIVLESNAFSPISTEADFRARYFAEGPALLAEATAPTSVIPREMSAFVSAMNATGPWEPVPTVLTGNQPWGPVEHGFFDRTVGRIEEMLSAGGAVDAVYVANHGAMVSTMSPDPDGEMLERIRRVVGAEARIVVTLDLHANLSERMVASADVVIGYQTNPHVDMVERGEEAAFTLRLLLAGTRARSTMIRLPLTPPSVSLLTATGPYADLIDLAQRRRREHAGAILNASVFGGFVFGDTPKNGLSVVVTGRDSAEPALDLAREIAVAAWGMRERFKRAITSIDEAVALASARTDPELEPLIFSDAGDNPGGGGSGNTTWLLDALVRAGARGVLYGSFFDPALAEAAHRAGEGGRLSAVFNRDGETEFSKRIEVPATVLRLYEGSMVGRRGLYGGRTLALGRACALEIGGPGGIVVVVISERHQTADPMFFEILDLDIGSARIVCVKSRGHFRAGFDLWFGPGQVIEVDTPGLTSPVLERFDWKRLPRPVYPLDDDASWSPPPPAVG